MIRFLTIDRRTKEHSGHVIFADSYEILPELDTMSGHRWGHFRRGGEVSVSIDATRWQVVDSGYGVAVPADEGDLMAVGVVSGPVHQRAPAW